MFIATLFAAGYLALGCAEGETLRAGVSVKTLQPSGIRLLLAPRPEARTVAIAAGWRVGSAGAGAATCGGAHLLEHLLAYHDTELSSAREIQARWRKLGSAPAGQTAPDWTLFTATARPEDLIEALELLREMLFHPAFSKAGLAREQEVLAAELLTRSRDPLLRGYHLAVQTLYGEDNYGLPQEGYVGTVREFSAESLITRYDTQYRPDRFALAIAGAFDPALVTEFLTETFGLYTAAGPPPEGLPPLPPAVSRSDLVVEQAPAPSAQLVAAFRGPPASDRDWLPFSVAAHMLAGGLGSVLRNRLVYQEGVAQRVELLVEPRTRGGFAMVRIILDPSQLDRCRREVIRALRHFSAGAFESSAVERGINSLLLSFARKVESPRGLAAELFRWDVLGDWSLPVSAGERLAAVTREQLERIAQLYFSASKVRFVAILPERFEYSPAEPLLPLTRERRRVNDPFPLVAQSLPDSKVYSFALVVWGGLAGDRRGQEGLGGLVARAVLRGRQGESPENFMQRLYRWGVRAEAGTKRDYSFLRFSVPEGAFEDTLEQIAAAVLHPNLYDLAALEKVRREIVAETVTFPSLAEAAERRLWQRAFAGTPYSVFPPGSRKALEALRVRLRVKATQYWERWWRPENFAAAVAGPRRVDELIVLVRRAFEPLAQYGPGTRWPVDFPLPDLKPRTILVPMELPESLFLLGWFTPDTSGEALAALLLARELLAGGPGSRLWKLRQNYGLLYHITGKVVVTRRVLELQISLLVPVEKLAAALDLLRAELERLAVEPVSTEELKLAKLAVRQRRLLRLEEGLNLVEEEAWGALVGWDPADLDRYLESTTPQSFMRTLRRIMPETARWTVAVGPQEVLRPYLEAHWAQATAK